MTSSTIHKIIDKQENLDQSEILSQQEVLKSSLEISDSVNSNLKSSKFIENFEKIMIAIGTLGQGLFYLQAYKIYIQGNAEAVSLPGFILASFSVACWLLYGITIKNKVLVIVNTIAVIGAILNFMAIFSVS